MGRADPVPSAQTLQADWCSSGGRVTLYADVLSEHSSLAVSGAPLAVSYLGSRFAGIDVPSTCP